MKWDREVDVLVFGAGMGGMTAALIAALEGLDVLLCEKTDQVGGTTATSAGTVWIPGSSQSVRDGKLVGAKSGGSYVSRAKSPYAAPSGRLPTSFAPAGAPKAIA